MATMAYPLRIPEEVITVSKLRVEIEHVDQATALRQFLHTGIEEFVVQLIAEGRLSIGKAVELLKTTHYDLYQIALKHGIKLSASPEQGRKSRETLKKLLS